MGVKKGISKEGWGFVQILTMAAFLLSFLSAPAFAAFSTAQKKHRPEGSQAETSQAERPVADAKKTDTRKSNENEKEVRETINTGASRILKSLGCVAEENKKNQFVNMVELWGAKIQDLGPEPKMISDKTRYSSYLRFVVWDYLKSDTICASTSNRCYQRLYKPLDELFSVFREGNLKDENTQSKVEALKKQIHEQVTELRSVYNNKPPCLDVEEKVEELSKSERVSDMTPPASPAVPVPPESKDTPKAQAEAKADIEPEPKVKLEAKKLDHQASEISKKDESKSEQRLLSPTPSRRSVLGKSTAANEIGSYKDALLKSGADARGVDNALNYFESHRNTFTNQRYISLMDATKKSSDEPYFLLDTQTLKVKRYDVSYGRGSVAGMNGIPTKFSKANVSGSYQTPPGALLVGEMTSGSSHSRVTLLRGLEERNKATLSRSVIMHDANYVRYGGRSWGCPAFDPKDFRQIQPLVSGGSFLYIYSPFADPDDRRDSRST